MPTIFGREEVQFQALEGWPAKKCAYVHVASKGYCQDQCCAGVGGGNVVPDDAFKRAVTTRVVVGGGLNGTSEFERVEWVGVVEKFQTVDDLWKLTSRGEVLAKVAQGDGRAGVAHGEVVCDVSALRVAVW